MQPSDSHTDFKVRLENRSTRDRKLVGLLPGTLDRTPSGLGENVVALSSPP